MKSFIVFLVVCFAATGAFARTTSETRARARRLAKGDASETTTKGSAHERAKTTTARARKAKQRRHSRTHPKLKSKRARRHHARTPGHKHVVAKLKTPGAKAPGDRITPEKAPEIPAEELPSAAALPTP